LRTPPQLKTGQNVTYRGASSAGPLPFRRRLGHAVARLAGWRIETTGLPDRCVIIGAHHTSAADFVVGMLVLLATGEEIRWAAKDTLFFGPVGSILRALGALPINRRERTNWVARMAATFQASHKFQLAILPEGTRRRTDHWKTGFYHIARTANVPIVFAFADYERRVAGWGPSLAPTGDIEADFQIIRDFYAGIHPRYPECASEVRVREDAQG
jgi:1-acyl-sn-glycerol-3-phosphate acyltransferase